MKLELRINPTQRLVRIRKDLTEAFGYQWTVMPNSRAMVVFSTGTPLKAVLKSMAVIEADLRLRADEARSRKGSRAGMRAELVDPPAPALSPSTHSTPQPRKLGASLIE